MINEKIKRKIETATVTLIKRGGQGILVNGRFIVTAAHCIDFNTEGLMAMEEYFTEQIRTFQGELNISVLAVEPVSDIGVLGSLDSQEAPIEAEKYEKFCKKIKPVKLFMGNFEIFKEYPVFIYTHLGTWISGKVMQTKDNAEKLVITADEKIEPGTSGSPVINESGDLVGIVANTSFDADLDGYYHGSFPFLKLALPVWIYKELTNAD